MVALTLGVVIDLMALIAMPLIEASWGDIQPIAVTTPHPEDPDDAGVQIPPFEDRLNMQSIAFGIVFLVGVRPRVVMSPDDDALDAIVMPRTDQVGHVHAVARQGVSSLERLLLDLATQLLEMLRDQARVENFFAEEIFRSGAQ